jgi:hypothetical protein
MMYPRSEILFPHQCVSTLRDLRGPLWQELVDRVASLPDTHEESLAFALMMIELAGCLDCDLDSYKASLGCCTCAKRTINAFKGSDKALLQLYQKACRELDEYMARKKEGSDPRAESAFAGT